MSHEGYHGMVNAYQVHLSILILYRNETWSFSHSKVGCWEKMWILWLIKIILLEEWRQLQI